MSPKNCWDLPKSALLSYFLSFWAKLSYNNSLLVRCEILGLLVNTLTTNYKYSCSNWENLPLPVQMQLSEGKDGMIKPFWLRLEEKIKMRSYRSIKTEAYCRIVRYFANSNNGFFGPCSLFKTWFLDRLSVERLTFKLDLESFRSLANHKKTKKMIEHPLTH